MKKNALIIGMIIALATLLADQLSKWLILEVLALPTREPIVVTSFFRLSMVWNRGMSFGMLSGLGEYAPHFFTAVAVAVSGALLWWMRKETRLWLIAAQGLIIGGALGNVIDRWRFGAVADFLDVHISTYHWPAFNVADSTIFIGVALLMWDAFRGQELESGDQGAEASFCEGANAAATIQLDDEWTASPKGSQKGKMHASEQAGLQSEASRRSPLGESKANESERCKSNAEMNAKTPTKVGFLATYKNDQGERRYLMYRAKPKKDADIVLPYQLARGSIEPGEDTLTAAKREAEEELGVTQGDVKTWRDAGVMEYASKKKGAYPIHWSIAELTRETPTEPLPIDAAGLQWMSKAQVLTGMQSGEIKASYREIFEALGSRL